MEIKQLEIFACVAKRLSFSKAAEELFVSQPTVSTQVNSLEKNLGVQLFTRNTKGVSLTKAGEECLLYAKKILSLRDEVRWRVSGEDKNTSGEVDIISSTIPAQHLLPGIIADFQKTWKNVIFRVVQADSRRVISEMSGFRYDFGLVGTVPRDERFCCIPIFGDELVLAVPADFPNDFTPSYDNFSKLIAKTPFIMRESGSGTRVEVEGLLSQIGINLKNLAVPAYFSDTHSILLAVSRNMGVSLVSKIAAAMYVDVGLVKTVEFHGEIFTRKIFLIYNKELWLSPMQKAFADEAKRKAVGEI